MLLSSQATRSGEVVETRVHYPVLRQNDDKFKVAKAGF